MPVCGLRKFHSNLGRKSFEANACRQTLPIRSEVEDLIHLLKEISGLCRYFRKPHLRGWCAVDCLRPTRSRATRRITDADKKFVQVALFEHR
ncbi:MAG: hypothetical protein ACI93T_002224 [Porticoccaceae bacterium]|jgi:hypothetical protein